MHELRARLFDILSMSLALIAITIVAGLLLACEAIDVIRCWMFRRTRTDMRVMYEFERE